MALSQPNWPTGLDLGAAIISAVLLRNHPNARFLTLNDRDGCGPFCADGHMFSHLATLPDANPFLERKILYIHE